MLAGIALEHTGSGWGALRCCHGLEVARLAYSCSGFQRGCLKISHRDAVSRASTTTRPPIPNAKL